jgi:hypothetical protein
MIGRVAVPAITGRPVSTHLALDIISPILMGFVIASAIEYGAKLRAEYRVLADTRQWRGVKAKPTSRGTEE